MNKIKQIVIGAALCTAAHYPMAMAQDGSFSFSVGAEYTTGDYGTSDTTDIWYFPATFKYETERHSIALTVPVVIVEGTGSVVPGGMGTHGGSLPSGTSTSSRTESGPGDIELRGSINLTMEDKHGPRIDLTGKIKFGTADAGDNLGTGEDDYAVQLDFERHYGANNLFGTLGYTVLGDPPGVDYNDVFYGTIGLSNRFSDNTTFGMALDAQEEVLPGADPAFELLLFMTSQSDAKTKATGYVIKGLSDGSPDWGVGVLLKFSQ
jgi:hypothetical protein